METINYPITQRRQRVSAFARELAADFHLSHKSFIQPLFVDEALLQRNAINGLPQVFTETIDSVLKTIENDIANGIHKFLLFPIPASKSLRPADFSFAVELVKWIKSFFGDSIWLAVDVCLCSYTTHGHCGVLNKECTEIDNNNTVAILANYATALANAGANCIAPSDMMDGRIAAIRTILNANKFDEVSIMSYSTKFSSQFYGPFRDACKSSPANSAIQNRKSYQISPFNSSDAIASSIRDDKEGADILMIKPSALYTDVIALLKQETRKPIAAYHVSGEYAAIELLVQHNFLDRAAAHVEVWTALQRSGANIIISYAARNAKQWIAKMNY